ncbi:MAG: amino acid adenylation domain-containing protein [Cyanobacteria bacterium SBLK]|nr:amino acid adenylation domain-containing protein [Cyanobacteria bacterium SBLK]
MSNLQKRLENLPPEKRALVLQKLKQRQQQQPLAPETKPSIPPIKPIPRTQPPPLSFAQSRLWFLHQLDGQGSHYNIPLFLELQGSLDIPVLRRAMIELVQRHEILRTRFCQRGDRAVQMSDRIVTVDLPLIDLQEQSAPQQAITASQLARDQLQHAFDLANDLLWQGKLLRLNPESHILSMVIHHIICDGWSLGILTRELSILYNAYRSDRSSPLPELPIQYADFASWQRQWLQGDVLQQQLHYWQEQLAGVPPLFELPTDRPRPSIQSLQGRSIAFNIDLPLTQKLHQLGQTSGATLFMTLLTAFAILLFRYSDRDDFVIGSPIANRNHQAIEPLIGCFVNTLALRINLPEHCTVRQLLARVRQTALDAYTHQDLPFEKLVEALKLPRSLSYNPLFQVMFSLQNMPTSDLKLGEAIVKPRPWQNTTTHFDLTLTMKETEQGLKGEWEYSCDLFETSTIERMAEHFKVLLEAMIAHPEQPIDTLPLLSAGEMQQLQAWNSTNRDYLQQTVVELFERQVQRNPQQMAICWGEHCLSYQQLNQQANQLAHYLRQRINVRPDTVVGVCLTRSLTMPIAILAILKAGGAYLAIDPHYPGDRIRYLIQDSGISLILTQTQLANTPPFVELQQSSPVATCEVLALDSLLATDALHSYSTENPFLIHSLENLAYIIYTSGSTGKPKGIEIEHRSLTHYTQAASEEYGITSRDRILQFASLSFDAAAEEIYPCLCNGSTLVLCSEAMWHSIPEFLQQSKDLQLTLWSLPTAYWHLVSQELASQNNSLPKSLRLVIIGGEKVLPEQVSLWSECVGNAVRVLNSYGPTEATIVATWYQLFPTDEATRAGWVGREIPIGRPLANVRAYVLDRAMQPLPVGIPGELYLGGAGLARGYLRRSQLTRQRFIEIALWGQPERVYQTGDRVRWLPDGNLEYIGRIDDQVKLRGFRIELGEIETTLAQHPTVQNAVVLLREDIPGNPQLVAYLTHASTPVDRWEIRQFLHQKLPAYMIPSAFVSLEQLPLNVNGKVDRRSLPTPHQKQIQETHNNTENQPIPPRTALELELVQIWEEILQRVQIGVRDDFFELGGHSLLAVSLIGRIERRFGKKLPLAILFEQATVEHLATWLSQQNNTYQWSSSTVVPLQLQGQHPPFFCVHPGGGTVVWYRDLARHLAPDCPFYALESLGLDGEQPPLDGVETMATQYIQAIQTVQPQGPYQIGGWCFGAVVAFEMAQQLQKRALDVSALILIDMNIGAAGDPADLEMSQTDVPFFLRLFQRHLPHLADTLVGLDTLSVDEQLLHLLERVKAAQKLPPDFGLVQTKRLLAVFRGHVQALATYQPQPYTGKAILLQADRGEAANAADPTLGWSNWVKGGIELSWLPGDHMAIVQEPNVQTLAQKLRTILHHDV